MTRNTLLSMLCLVLLWQFSGTCSAEYTMSEQELTKLEQNLTQLSMNNEKLTKDYSESQKDLATALKSLNELSQALNQCKVDLELTKAHSATAQKLLQTANASLATFEREEKAKIRSLTIQRDLGYIGLAYVLLRK